MREYPRALAERPRVTACNIEYVGDGLNEFGQEERCGDRFGGAAKKGVGSVEIKFEIVGNIGRNAAARDPADIW